MTTNYPGGTTPTGPVGPSNLPPDRDDAAWGCIWWWWLLIIIIIILIIWWAGWGWGPYGGYWFRTRPAGTGTGAGAPAGGGAGTSGGAAAPANRSTGEGTAQPSSRPGMVLPSGLLIRF